MLQKLRSVHLFFWLGGRGWRAIVRTPGASFARLIQAAAPNTVQETSSVDFRIAIRLRLSPGRDDSPMPVTTVTGPRPVVVPQSRRDDSKVQYPRTFKATVT